MTPPDQPQDRDAEIKAIHRDYRHFYQLLRGAVLVALLAALGLLIFNADVPGYWQNIYVTVVGAIGTVLIIDQRAEQRAIRQRKEELIAQMGSQSHDFALEAVRLLRRYGWLEDGSLRDSFLPSAVLFGADLESANLQGAIMDDANLQGADLLFADLHGSRLRRAKLEGAKLEESDLRVADLCQANLKDVDMQNANLEKAVLGFTDLQGANLQGCCFRGASFIQANLRGADLEFSDLRGAFLHDTFFDQSTTLPDGSHWTPNTDLSRFTDPNHSQFWLSSDPSSPAYRSQPNPSA
jgi:uncharacterized protein YjbI with pentapeptide repeats